MKVLLLAQFLPPMGGGEERHVWTLARALSARAHEVTLLGFATDPEDDRPRRTGPAVGRGRTNGRQGRSEAVGDRQNRFRRCLTNRIEVSGRPTERPRRSRVASWQQHSSRSGCESRSTSHTDCKTYRLQAET
jgi:Glycosyltransferase Family 4